MKPIHVAATRENHLSEQEQSRIANLLAMVPAGCASLLEIGARDGYMTHDLTGVAGHVTALDLVKPRIDSDRVTAVQGDVTALPFDADHFDGVLCAEVLEHIRPTLLDRACSEIVRVARRFVIVGVPYQQDTRFGRTTCAACGTRNPPWGHVNAFDERRLASLLRGARVERTCFVGKRLDRTNWLSTWLMDFAGNPYGIYGQEEACIHCGARLVRPERRTVPQRVATRVAAVLQRVQSLFIRPTRAWIHVLLVKQA